VVARSQPDLDAIYRKIIAKAKRGDPASCRLVLDRLDPIRRGRPVTFELPDIDDAAGLMAAHAALLKQISTGRLTPDEAGPISGMIASHLKALEITEVTTRIAALEKKAGIR
jgi:hypothetical protein